MKELYETSPNVGEVRSSALKTSRDGKKTGNNMLFTISKTLGLFMLSQVITCIGMMAYFAINIVKTTDVTGDFSFEITFGDGMIDKNLILIMLFSEIFMIMIFVLYAKFKEKLSLAALGFTKKNMPLAYMAGILGAALSMFAASLICLFTGAFTIETAEISAPYMILFALGWIIQGLAEEVMCRGYLMTVIARRYSMPVAIIVSSLVFATLHVLNPSGITVLAFVNLCLYGVFASLLFLYSENIWLCAGYHTVWNMIQGNILGIPVSGVKVPSVLTTTFNNQLSYINGGSFGLEGGIGVTIVLFIGCIIIFILNKRKRRHQIADGHM